MIAHLWDLAAEVTDRAYGTKDIFHDRTEADELVLQRDGELVVRDLHSGRYDVGLSAAVKGNVGHWRSPSFRSLVSSYKGPITSAETGLIYVPQLVDAHQFCFSKFVTPKYPRLAIQAHIQGVVELQLGVDLATGEVHDAVTLSGHGLLSASAIEAATQWRFAPNSVNSGTLKVTLNFAFRCP
jgi:TonB family protein